MKKVGRSNSIIKNVVSGVLLLGGLAAGVIGAAGMVAHANESSSVDMRRTTRSGDVENDNQKFSEIMIPLSEIETEEDLINLVIENGTQVIIDEESGQIYVAYINENNQIEIAEITEEELSELINQVNMISTMDVQSLPEEQSQEIPQEYWRSVDEKEQNKNRKRLDSEEGKEAVEKARKYKNGKK